MQLMLLCVAVRLCVQLMWLCVAVRCVCAADVIVCSCEIVLLSSVGHLAVGPTAVSALYGSHCIVAQLYCNMFLLKCKAPSSDQQGAKESCYVQHRSSCMGRDLTLRDHMIKHKSCVLESYRKDIKQ